MAKRKKKVSIELESGALTKYQKKVIEMYFAVVPAYTSYSLMHDALEELEILRSKLTVKGEIKRTFNKMKDDADKFKRSALHTVDKTNEVLVEVGNDKDTLGGLLDIVESYTRRLYDILLSSIKDPMVFEKVWDFFNTCESADIIKWNEPDLKYLEKITDEE